MEIRYNSDGFRCFLGGVCLVVMCVVCYICSFVSRPEVRSLVKRAISSLKWCVSICVRRYLQAFINSTCMVMHFTIVGIVPRAVAYH